MPRRKDQLYYVIEEGIPIPPRDYSNRRSPYAPFKEMRVGDSFLIPPEADSQALKRRMFKFINEKKDEGVVIRYCERKMEGGAKRIWRTE